MHEDNEFIEFVTAGEQEYEEVIEEYEEEILIQKGAPDPSAADFADTLPAQGKPRRITLFWISTEYIYIWCAFMLQAFYGNHLHKYIYPMSPTSTGASSCYA